MKRGSQIRIALVRALDGHMSVCGPHDYDPKDYKDAMSAALSWHIEAGHLPAECMWIAVPLPPVPQVAELRVAAEKGEFPASFLEGLE